MSLDDDPRDAQPPPEERLEIGTGGRWPPPSWVTWATARLRGPTRATAVVVASAMLVACVAAAAVAVQSRGDADLSAARAQVLALERREQRDAVNADTADLDQLLAPGLEFVTPDGETLTREEYLDALDSGELDFVTYEPITPMEVRTDGRQAVVTFLSRLDVSADCLRLKHQAWHTVVYVRTGGRWQLVWAQTTAVGGFPPRTR
jgi:hypothetical protein